MHSPSGKYKPYPQVEYRERTWPDRRITQAPRWCSVDLRDGNQALIEPMLPDEKLKMFHLLVEMGFKEIEVGFPSASQAEYDMLRALIGEGHIPEDVLIQVLVPAREQLIEKTFKALEGVKQAIVHLYINTSPFFRQVVFSSDKKGVLEKARRGARCILDTAQKYQSRFLYQFSPESFNVTETDYALDFCAAMLEEFGATKENPLILNLPATVELSTPNLYADQIERFSRTLPGRDRAVLSVHPHNDRGTGVASAELAIMAGAERVEGTLFGNGERTGNVDLVTVALNMYTQGVDPKLDFSRINETKRRFEMLTKMRVYERQPYSGEMVFTAFSGTHQDAIKKGFDYLRENKLTIWGVPYITMDPKDLGREYEPIIRINSQSGKGGAAYILQTGFGYNLPRGMHAEFGMCVQHAAETAAGELSAEHILRIFLAEYCDVDSPYSLISHEISETGAGGHSIVRFSGLIRYRAREYTLKGEGNGPIDAFFSALQEAHIDGFTFASYHEHAISSGSDAKAVAYIELKYHGRSVYGVGIESNVSIASIKGVISAINRALRREEE
ncbi:MAG: 2-isopropylmalate synthase [Christensenellales bacterium]|jgi:2-isopropylmalate synthase